MTESRRRRYSASLQEQGGFGRLAGRQDRGGGACKKAWVVAGHAVPLAVRCGGPIKSDRILSEDSESVKSSRESRLARC